VSPAEDSPVLLKNTTTPRVFIAATRQNEGKTTISLGLLAAMQNVYPRIGYIKPVGQRFVEIEEQKIDEDTVLMDRVYRLNCPLVDMSPIAIEPDFTRKYLESSNYDVLVKRIQNAFDRVAWEKDFVLCEGSGHAGVGSVFDLSNARVAKLLGAKVIIVTQGGIGRPIDEVSLNHALFEKEGVEVIGVIINKVLGKKIEYVTEFARRGFERKGLELLGVVPHQPLLSQPNMELIREELGAEVLNNSAEFNNPVEEVLIGAMGVQNALHLFKKGVLIITPGDREDIILAAATALSGEQDCGLAGMILTRNLKPSPAAQKVISTMPFPVLSVAEDSYFVASTVHDLNVKTRPDDAQKITLIRDLIAQHVDVNKILEALSCCVAHEP
jgi:BioD-like phosphotransacetylase family protein